ncbi:hypothetical protein Zmor_022749 [Zophobas morio]|uniref:Uncharacterized protein n=1 Tax=Zophobas morio TaxID=2755281 RepID=A0AA38HX13_9CUCU|nr:hypothetical protein Zmor_022749 [Zophobas morio]
MKPEKPRRCSLFRRNSGNPSYSDKLKAEIQNYLEFLEKKQDESVTSPEPRQAVVLSENKKNFLTSLPSVECYVEVMTQFLDQHNAQCQKKKEMKTVLQNQLELI